MARPRDRALARTSNRGPIIRHRDLKNELTARAAAVELDEDALRRYGRHLVLPEVGEEGQKRLRAARVLLIGAGGLGSPAALYLAAAGIGTLGIVDDDRVEISNLQRQVLYASSDQGRPKAEAARDRLVGLEPRIDVVPVVERLGEENVLRLLDGWDLVLDGSDNFPTRYLVNDACVLLGTPLVWGAVQRFEGQLSVFAAPSGPCYRCLFPEPPPAGSVPTCAEAGVLGVLPGIVGTMQANEAIKLILGRGEPLVGRFVSFDALRFRFRELSLSRDRSCAVCGEEPTIRSPQTVAETCELGTEESMERGSSVPSIDLVTPLPEEITVHRLADWLEGGQPVRLLDVREAWEAKIVCLGESQDLIPLRQLPERLGEIDPKQVLVVYCHHGSRSAAAVRFLREQGFHRVTNLAGGIDAWSREIDPSKPRY